MTATPIQQAKLRPEQGIATGMEWIVEAFDCDPDRLRDLDLVGKICMWLQADNLEIKQITRGLPTDCPDLSRGQS